MNIKTALKPFRRRLTAEAILRSALSAGLIAAGTSLVLGVVHVLLPWLIPELWIMMIFAGLFTVCFGLLLLLKYRPTKAYLAKRLDELGLSERVETMLELEGRDTPAARLQREDTVAHLQATPKKSLRIRISKVKAVLCALLLAGTAVLLLVPEVNLISRYDIINRLNQLLDDSPVEDDLREDLSEIIDQLEDQLDRNKDKQNYAENLQNAQDAIEERVDREVTRDEIGEALQEFEDLKELGEAIQKGDKQGVSTALDGLEDKMEEDPAMRESVADQLKEALERSQTPSDDTLHQALATMSQGLRDPAQSLEETMDQAESEIHAALDQQQNASDLGQQMQDVLDSAQSSGGEGAETQPAGPQEGDADGPGGSKPGDGQSQGGIGNNGGGEGPGSTGNVIGNGSTNMNDKISDPSSRFHVDYGDVYAAYVAEFLKQAEEGNLPPDLVAAMNAYLEGLKK